MTWNDLPENERINFNYVVDQHMDNYGSCDEMAFERRFFNYLGSWYDYFEFEIATDDVKALGFDGMQVDSVWSATVVSYFDKDGYTLDDQVIVGRIHW
jgi:hypothetical protein